MLYSIIPPILIVLSLAGMIALLVKKSKTMTVLPRKSFPLRVRERVSLGEKVKKVFSALNIFAKIKEHLPERDGKIGSRFYSFKKEPGSDQIGTEEKKYSAFIRKRIEESALKEKEVVSEKEPASTRGDISSTKGGEIVSETVVISRPSAFQETVAHKDILEKILIERIAANPKDVEAYERLGEYYFEIENWEYAKECFKQIIKLNPENKNVRTKMKELEKILAK
jgi:tetratricopeptide (TPR) repeat protein